MSYKWLINHETMRSALRPLWRLQKLSFRRDTYMDRLSESENANDYYTARRVSETKMSSPLPDPSNPSQLFEIRHRNMILTEAQKYVDVFLSLKWMYFGQLPMGVAVNSFGWRVPQTLFHQRDDCITALDRIFRVEDWR